MDYVRDLGANPDPMGRTAGARPRRRRRLWTAAALALAAAAAWSLTRTPPTSGSTAARPQPPVAVAAAAAARQDLPLWLTGIGTVQAFNTVTVKPRVSGQIVELRFVEGKAVRRGDVLAQIDPKPFAAQLHQAQAAKAKDEFQLANAKLDLGRFANLVAKGYASSQSVDTQKAQVAMLQAALEADQAAIDAAQIQLDYATVTSPIDGIPGIRIVDAGNVISPGDPGLVVITQVVPISVVFALPEDEIASLGVGQPTATMAVSVFSRDDRTKLADGTLALVDNQIDQGTGTVRLKATFPNNDHALKPGEFVNARLLVATLRNVVTIPADAVQIDERGPWVYGIGSDGAVAQRRIATGPTNDGVTVVESGLGPGERVVTDNQYSLRPGSNVAVTARPPGAPATDGAAGSPQP
jgi:multidrug efflux system membrane fusion protein